MEAFREIYPQTFLHRYLEHNVRPDGRALGEVRGTSLICGNLSHPTTVGSAFVRQGGTSVVAGVKAVLGQTGVNFHVEMSPLCNGERPGLPSAFALFCKEKIGHLLSPAVDPTSLVVDEARGVGWALNVDVYCVDDDGSVFDALVLASVAALTNVRLSQLVWSDSQGLFVEQQGSKRCLKVVDPPFSLTFALVDRWIVSDPNHEEEDVADASVSIVWRASGALSCVEKRGGMAISRSGLEQCMGAARRRVGELEKILQAAATTNSQ